MCEVFVQAEGEVTYNGHALNEFVREKTSAYISQHDTHMGELTVRETLDFSSRCQGVGSRYGIFILNFYWTMCVYTVDGLNHYFLSNWQ